MLTIILIGAAVLVVGGLVLGVLLSGNRKAPAASAEGAPAPAGNPRADVRATGTGD